MRHFVRNLIKGGRCNAFIQHQKSEISDEVFNILSKELIDNGNVYEFLEKYFEYTNKHRKIKENEYDSQFNDYRENDEEEKTDHINKKLNKLPIHKELSKVDSNQTQKDYDANSLYLSSIWDEKSVYPKIETGFNFKPEMNDVYVEEFNNQTFKQDVDESARLKIK